MEDKRKWFWVLVGFSIFCILMEYIRVMNCYQDPCCEIHWLMIHKEATCPIFGSGGLPLP